MTTTWDSIANGAGDYAATIESVTVIPYQLTADGPTYDLLRITITPPQAALDLVWNYQMARVWQADEAQGYRPLSWSSANPELRWMVPGSDEVSSFSPMPLRPPLPCGLFAYEEGDPEDPGYPYNIVIYPTFWDPPENSEPHKSRIVGITTDTARWGSPSIMASPESGHVWTAGAAPLEVSFSLVSVS